MRKNILKKRDILSNKLSKYFFANKYNRLCVFLNIRGSASIKSIDSQFFNSFLFM